MEPIRQNRMVVWVFGTLTILFIGFIVYASWTPSDAAGNTDGLWTGLSDLGSLFDGHNLRDIGTNVLLYIPLGVFTALTFARKLHRDSPSAIARWLPILFGTAISLCMEVGQSFIGRTPDLVDLITNTLGHVLGYCMVVVAIRVYGLNPIVFMGLDPNDEQDRKTQSIAAFRFIAICLYVLVALLPFDVSVQASRIYAQLLADETGVPKIILDPLYSLSRWQNTGGKLSFELWALIPIGALTAFLGGIRGRMRLIPSIASCVFLVVLCEGAQIFIMSRRTDTVMIALAVVAAILGWALVKAWFRLQPGHMPSGSQRAEVGWQELSVALLVYMSFICFFAWSPFVFETDFAAVLSKIRHESNLMPFKQHFATRSLSSAVDIVKEAGLFLPFGVLTARLLSNLRPSMPRVQRLLATAFVSGCFALGTELSQAVCVGRYIDSTDVLLAAAGGLCGAALLQLFFVQVSKHET